MDFQVKHLDFDGPLDLMLHLIHEQKMNIFDLNMDLLIDQYITYINQIEVLKLEEQSEYLVELSRLVEYKSKKILPNKEVELEDEYEEDPKERLVKRLIEYQQFKEISKTLDDYFHQRQEYLTKDASYQELTNEVFNDLNDQKYEGKVIDLYKAMNRVLKRIELSKPMEIRYTEKELSTEDRILEIKARLINLQDQFSFTKLCDDCVNVQQYVVTFLAVLEMVKDHVLVFTVDNEEILFQKGVNNE